MKEEKQHTEESGEEQQINYPFVKYMSVKVNRDRPKQKGEEVLHTGTLRVDGCKNNVEQLVKLEREGKKLVGYGNLGPKQKELKNYIDMRLGNAGHPALRGASVMDQKIEQAARAKGGK